MAFNKKTIRDVPLDGQPVLLRADYNVPIKNGEITDDYRIQQSLPTIRHLLDRGCSIVICSHLGRPEGKPNPQYSLEPIAAHLGDLLRQPVGFIPASIGDRVRQATKRLGPGQILLLENLRFQPQEEANDPTFAQALAKDTGAAYFVQDGFGVVHRAHASTDAITQFIPSVAGLLLEKEVSTIRGAMENPKHPLVGILGGAKVSDKIKIINRLVGLADKLIIGGAMANTFLQYKGLQIGQSIHEDGLTEELDKIYRSAVDKLSGKMSVDEFLVLPVDVVVAKSLDPGSPTNVVEVNQVAPDDYILDLGGRTAQRAVDNLAGAGTVIWNGTLGMAEQPAYAKASQRVAEALATQPDTMSIIGGGDTVDFILNWDHDQASKFSIVSTGGGASLELMSGEKLPGVEALLDK